MLTSSDVRCLKCVESLFASLQVSQNFVGMGNVSKLGLMVLAVFVVSGLNWLINPAQAIWSEESLGEGELLLRDSTVVQGKVLWIDARSADEFAKEHIPGAVLLNESDWDSLFPNLLDVWQPGDRIIVYCSSSSCQASHEVAERLRGEAGFDEVYVLKGGWETWRAAQE